MNQLEKLSEMLRLTMKADFSPEDRAYLWDTFSKRFFAEEHQVSLCPITGEFLDPVDETLWRIAYPALTGPA